jgi:hypothetical protein
MFISEPHEGQIYIAERSRKGSSKFLWSVMPVEPVAADVRIEARDVPRQIRRRAYKLFEGDRLRNSVTCDWNPKKDSELTMPFARIENYGD